MSNQMQVFSPGARPQHLAKIQSDASITDLTAGVQASFPILRMKGKVWSVTMNGATKPLLTAEGYPVPAMRVVLVKANPFASKTFYRSGFADGDAAPPDCWSFDGNKPDSSVQNPIAQTCAACPNNRIGSRISESGSKVKACSDVKRVAVMEPKSGTMMLLRLPYTSMKSLASYAVWLSGQSPAVNYNEVLTEMAFDMSAAYPQVNFKATRWLDENETELVQAALVDPALQDILGGRGDEFHGDAQQPQQPLPPRKSPQQEVAETFDAPPPRKSAPAPVPVAEEEGEEEEAPPPPPPRKAAAKPKDAPAQRPVVVDSGSLEDALAAALRT